MIAVCSRIGGVGGSVWNTAELCTLHSSCFYYPRRASNPKDFLTDLNIDDYLCAILLFFFFLSKVGETQKIIHCKFMKKKNINRNYIPNYKLNLT